MAKSEPESLVLLEPQVRREMLDVTDSISRKETYCIKLGLLANYGSLHVGNTLCIA